MHKKFRFRGPFDKQHGKRAQAPWKLGSNYLYHIHLSLGRKFCSKKFLLLTWQILGLLVNTLAAGEKNPPLNKDNLTLTIQIQLSKQ